METDYCEPQCCLVRWLIIPVALACYVSGTKKSVMLRVTQGRWPQCCSACNWSVSEQPSTLLDANNHQSLDYLRVIPGLHTHMRLVRVLWLITNTSWVYSYCCFQIATYTVKFSLFWSFFLSLKYLHISDMYIHYVTNNALFAQE